MSKVPLNLTPGTLGSISMLEHLTAANEDMLYGQLQVIIDYKWEKDKYQIKMLSYLSILHLLILCTHLIFLQENKAIVWVLLFFTVIQAIRVAVSIYVSDSIGRYLEVLWNWLDLFGCLSLLLHCAGALFDEGMVLYRYYADAVLISAFCMLLRGVSTISPFSTRIRLLLGVFIETFKDIYAFLILFAYMIGSMSVLHVVVKRADPQYQEKI